MLARSVAYFALHRASDVVSSALSDCGDHVARSELTAFAVQRFKKFGAVLISIGKPVFFATDAFQHTVVVILGVLGSTRERTDDLAD